MQVKKKEIKDSVLKVELSINKGEFDAARKKAYLAATDHYPVMGKAPGLAELADLEKSYGPAVLYDEAIALVLPEAFQNFLKQEKIRVMGKPQVEDISFEEAGGVAFRITADMFPQIILGQYEGIAVPYSRMENQVEFEQAVLQKACESMQGEIPLHMVEQKLNAIEAQKKIDVNNDSIYHLLADMLEILDEAYKAAGAVRPMVQVRREALDLMLQTASAENENDWQNFFQQQIRNMVERYHDLPQDFDAIVDQIHRKRKEKVEKYTPEELTAELFKVFLGSMELSEEQWRNQMRLQAAREVCLDLLLMGVAEEKKIEISAEEVHAFITELADRYQMQEEEVEANISKEPLIDKLKRDKALAYILSSAVTDEAGKAERERKQKEAREKGTDESIS